MVDKQIRAAFDHVEPPCALSGAVDAALRAGRRKHLLSRAAARAGLAAAALCLLLITALNLSPAFASAAWDVPVLGPICRVFTFRHYDFADQVKVVDVRVPAIESGAAPELEAQVNAEISRILQAEVAEAEARAEAYYEAYVATGGDPDSFIPVEIKTDYALKYAGEDRLSFLVYKYESTGGLSALYHYYNLDLETGRALTLPDILGPDYKALVLEQVQLQLAALPEETRQLLFPEVELSTMISENMPFYIPENGQGVVVVFEKYQIAAGAAGRLEFPIAVPDGGN